ncbi:hypothetical protein SDC9_209568 [bioreactor metagenome]|uniref:Uncharacterized protein n=1 Tax=bioreactor metagenome TaxID=1076179 RepID=A0A645JNB6_9ZZZZ
MPDHLSVIGGLQIPQESHPISACVQRAGEATVRMPDSRQIAILQRGPRGGHADLTAGLEPNIGKPERQRLGAHITETHAGVTV